MWIILLRTREPLTRTHRASGFAVVTQTCRIIVDYFTLQSFICLYSVVILRLSEPILGLVQSTPT